MHIYGKSSDIIPPQRPDAAGVDVFVDQAVQQPGFYALGSAAGGDTTLLALNQDKQESQLNFRDIADLKKTWKGDSIHWLSITDSGGITDSGSSFPLWKICIFLAVLMLAAETVMLGRVKVAAAA